VIRRLLLAGAVLAIACLAWPSQREPLSVRAALERGSMTRIRVTVTRFPVTGDRLLTVTGYTEEGFLVTDTQRDLYPGVAAQHVIYWQETPSGVLLIIARVFDEAAQLTASRTAQIIIP